MDFTGRIAFITGGAGGIGLALCRAFGARGMNDAPAEASKPARTGTTKA